MAWFQGRYNSEISLRLSDDFELVVCVGEAHSLVALVILQRGGLGIRLDLIALEGLIRAVIDVVPRNCDSIRLTAHRELRVRKGQRAGLDTRVVDTYLHGQLLLLLDMILLSIVCN